MEKAAFVSDEFIEEVGEALSAVWRYGWIFRTKKELLQILQQEIMRYRPSAGNRAKISQRAIHAVLSQALAKKGMELIIKIDYVATG